MSVFVINPGSTSTKLGLFEEGKALFVKEYQHPKDYLDRFERVIDQLEIRMDAVRDFFATTDIDTASIAAVAGRGGLLHPLKGGVYEVSDDMITDLTKARYGEHPCNLGAVLARECAQEWAVPAFIVDPVVTDELMDVARFTGFPAIERRSLFHALNQRAAARKAAANQGCEYETSSFIVCHMGGGISIGAHRNGAVVDVVNALDGEGPFTPERTGGLPIIPVLEMIERGEKTPEDLKKIILREGGLFAHFGTNDPREIVRRADSGDIKAKQVFAALAYSIAKHIASMVPALVDEVNGYALTAIVLTGGMARSKELVHELKRLIGCLGPVEVMEGEEEMAALAAGAEMALNNPAVVEKYYSRR